MRIRHLGYAAALAAFALSNGIATANCQLARLGSMPVDMQGLAPIVSAEINGVAARFLLDSGDFYSMISGSAAAQYGLRVSSVSRQGYSVRGLGGDESARMTTMKSFEFAGLTVPSIQFLVIDEPFGDELAGVIGQNILRASDVEYDLANGTVQFFKPVGCEQQPLAYWAVKTPYTAVDLQSMDSTEDHLRSTAIVNGRNVTVWFDTGSSRSFLSLEAAARAGITPTSPGVTILGLSGGIGPGSYKVWSIPVDSFQLGGEKVQHTHLLMRDLDPAHRIGEVGDSMPDMLLGEDFFLSHRIYVAYSQQKIYFTYNGGPLFNLNLPQGAPEASKPPPETGTTAQAGTSVGQQADTDTPTDANGFKRRGMAYASMQEFDRAIADLTRACELAPNDADDRYQRALIYIEAHEVKLAVQDLDTAITLQPGDTSARLQRAWLLQANPDVFPTAKSEIKSDADTLNRLFTPDARARLGLGQLYGGLGDYSDAMDQINEWLSHHPQPYDQAEGLNARCWARATADRDLQKALDDCDRALDMRPSGDAETGSIIRQPLAADDPDILDSRGLVYLRLGNPHDAINDYDSALKINPRIASSLYGRGLAELSLGEKSEGQADLAAAASIDSGVAKRYATMGLTP